MVFEHDDRKPYEFIWFLVLLINFPLPYGESIGTYIGNYGNLEGAKGHEAIDMHRKVHETIGNYKKL